MFLEVINFKGAQFLHRLAILQVPCMPEKFTVDQKRFIVIIGLASYSLGLVSTLLIQVLIKKSIKI